MQLSKQLKLTETQVRNNSSGNFVTIGLKTLRSIDKNMVSKSSDQMETKIYQRFGNAGSTVLFVAGPSGTEASVYWRPIVVRFISRQLRQIKIEQKRWMKVSESIW